MLNLEQIKSLNKNTGFFRFKKFDKETYLITNDIGRYCFLTNKEFGDYILGNITSGEKYEELLKGKFLKGGEGFEKEMASAFAKKNEFLSYGPSLHIIVATLRCNHKCQYCHAAVAPMSATEMDMSIETAKKVVDTIFYTNSPYLTIEFQGGEATVNWDVVKYVVEYAEIKAKHLKKDLTFALVTNLTNMDDDKLDYSIKHNIGISTSLDGDEELHNFNRVYKEGNSFKEVTYWIKRINDRYKREGLNQKVGALLTVTKKGLPKYKEIIDIYVNLGLDGIFLRPLNPYGFAAAELDKLGYTMDEFIEFYNNSMNYILELNKKGVNFIEMLSSIYLRKILTDRDPNYMEGRSPCGACIGQVAYNYDGKIYSCDEGRMLARMGDYNFQMGEVKDSGEETYRDMMMSDTTKIMVQASTLDGLPGYNDSIYKAYVGVCPIHSYKTNGNIIANYSKDQKKYLDYKVLDYLFENLRSKDNKAIFEKWIGGENNLVTSQCETI